MAGEPIRFDLGKMAGGALNQVTGFFQRVFVHALGFISGLVLVNVFPVPETSFLAAGLGVYAGVICLIGRNASLTPAWLFPPLVGLIQSIISLVLSGSPVVALFWGGVQAFIQRAAQKKGRIGSEWLVLLLLLPLGFVFAAKSALAWLNPLIAALLGLAGWGLGRRLVRLPLTSLQVRRLREGGLALEHLAGSGALPETLALGARKLSGLLRDYSEEVVLLPGESEALVRAVEVFTAQTKEFAARQNPRTWDAGAGALQAASERLLGMLRGVLPGRQPEPEVRGATEEKRDTPVTAGYRESLQRLVGKKHLLPPELQAHLEAIAISGAGILECMIKDSRDEDAGKRFLDRYLKAAHKVVDDRARLSREEFAGDDVAKALALSADMLARLETAFAKEYQILLRNDVIDFSADLKVLDTLLTMDGR